MKLKSRNLTFLTLIVSLFLAMIAKSQTTNTLFYIVAHPDDWQLFMNPYAYINAQSKANKIVFIYTSAGEAGYGLNPLPDLKKPYYLAREKGAISAARFLADGKDPGDESLLKTKTIELFENKIQRVKYKNTVSYFLRIPDGGGSGTIGVPQKTYLERMLKDPNLTVNSIDNQSVYTKEVLTNTLYQIIVKESQNANLIDINTTDNNDDFNKGSHTDHRATSVFAQDAIKNVGCIGTYLFLDYDKSEESIINSNIIKDNFILPLLSLEDVIINAAVWGVTTSAIARNGAPSTFEPGHNKWLSNIAYRGVGGKGCPANTFPKPLY